MTRLNRSMGAGQMIEYISCIMVELIMVELIVPIIQVLENGRVVYYFPVWILQSWIMVELVNHFPDIIF